MTESPRIDQAIKPAGLVSSAKAYSLFIADQGLYLIATGRGWRMNFRGVSQNELMAEKVRAVEKILNPALLGQEVAAREGSFFIPREDLTSVVLGSRFDGLPDLRFNGNGKKHRFHFNDDRQKDVEAFVSELLSLLATESHCDDRHYISFEGTSIETVALSSPCWGATPHVAAVDGRLFVEHLAPAGSHHSDKFVVYRSSLTEQSSYEVGELDLGELCERLVNDAYGTNS